MEMIIVKRDSDEWNYMWEYVATHPINEGLPDTSIAMNQGEAWQYIGSFKSGKRVVHEFRHRNHPNTQKVEVIKLHGNENLGTDDIEKVIPVK
jgi:hypothetical protein